MTEEWRDIPGYEGLYQASSYGQIRSLDRTIMRRGGKPMFSKGRVLKPSKCSQLGYLNVYLSNANRERRLCLVHRLVLETFVGPCPPGMQACHSPDRCPRNNAVTNLRWGTYSENAHDRTIHETILFGEKNPQAALTAEEVLQIRSLYRRNEYGFKKLAKQFGVLPATVQKIVHRQRWSHI